jgi:hypothetical protein
VECGSFRERGKLGLEVQSVVAVWVRQGNVTAQTAPLAYQGGRHDYQRALMCVERKLRDRMVLHSSVSRYRRQRSLIQPCRSYRSARQSPNRLGRPGAW